jgi:hypothetical protein
LHNHRHAAGRCRQFALHAREERQVACVYLIGVIEIRSSISGMYPDLNNDKVSRIDKNPICLSFLPCWLCPAPRQTHRACQPGRIIPVSF